MCETKGVHFDNHMQRWVGKLTKDGNSIRSTFVNKEDAIKFRKGLEKAMEQKIKFDKASMTFKVVDIEEDVRPANYCIEDATYSMIINNGYKSFEKLNLSTREVDADSFRFPSERYTIIYSKNATIVILEDGCKGISKCDPEDVFSRRLGEEIAYGRAKAKSLKKKYGHVR